MKDVRGALLCGIVGFGLAASAVATAATKVERGVRARFGMTEENCLHCEINEVVREHIEGAGNDPVNLPELVGKVGESLVDLIMLGPEEQWGNLLAEAMRQIGDAFLEKSGAVQGETAH